jgi:hypothetical protein
VSDPHLTPVWPQTPDQQALDCAAARHPATEQPCRKHAGVVDDDEIAGAQESGKRGDVGVDNGPAVAIESQQARRAAVRRRLLRDQFGRKVEVELTDVHLVDRPD